MVYLTAFGFRIVALLLSLVNAAVFPLSVFWTPSLKGQTLLGDVTVTAHSGCLHTPDNSVTSMEAGVASGAEIIEFDLNFRTDGTPVLSHDDPGESDCVTLAEAFAFLAAHPGVKANVDVKSTAFIGKVQPMAQEAGVLGQIFFTGLDENTIPIASRACPDIPYYLNVMATQDEDLQTLAEKAAALGAVGVNLDHRNASPQLVGVMHANGLLVSVWTIEKAKEAVRALRMGVDNVTTQNPALVRLMLPRIRFF